MTNNTRGISSDIRSGGQNLETVQSFKHLGSVMMDEGSNRKFWIAQTVGALSKLETIWKVKNIGLCSKTRMMCSFLNASETWTLTVELENTSYRNEMLSKTFGHLLQGSCYE